MKRGFSLTTCLLEMFSDKENMGKSSKIPFRRHSANRYFLL